MKKLFAIAYWIVQTKAYEWLVKKVIANLNVRIYGYPKLPASSYFDINEKMSQGKHKLYVWASSDTKSIASFAIRVLTRSKYSHAGIAVVNPGTGIAEAIHMKASGMAYEPLVDLLAQVDTFTMCELDLEKEEQPMVWERLVGLLAKKDEIRYDFEQKLGGQALYCSELIWYLLQDTKHKTGLSTHLGREAFPPNLVVKLGRIIWSKLP